MRSSDRFANILTLASACLLVAAWPTRGDSQTRTSVAIDSDDIGGVVTSASGPEAGVWVIAETDAFNTRFARIVVTDDEGRYVIPDLPPAANRE